MSDQPPPQPYPHARTDGMTYDDWWNWALLNRDVGIDPPLHFPQHLTSTRYPR
jgi:hypothetical protein